MVHADGQREDEEHDEGEPPHRVAVEPPASRLRQQRVQGDIGRHQPEIDNPVQCHREQRAAEAGVDQIAPAEGPRQQYADEFELNARRSPGPQQRRRGDREHGERHRPAGIVALPADHVDDHQHDPDHRSADQQERPDVIPGARQERRVEGVEHRCPTGEDRRRGDHRASEADSEADPGRQHAANGSTEACRRHRIAEAHREESGQHVGHHRPVQGHGGVIGVRIVERCRQRATHQHLPGP